MGLRLVGWVIRVSWDKLSLKWALCCYIVNTKSAKSDDTCPIHELFSLFV